MKATPLILSLLVAAACGPLARASSPELYTEFRLTHVSGTVQVRTSRIGGLREAEAESLYDLGTSIVTGEGGSARVEFSEDNYFDVQPDSKIRVVRGRAEGKEDALLVILQVGRIAVTLEDYPDTWGFMVRTPMGTYSVVGTIFEVYTGIGPGGEIISNCACTRGEVDFAANVIQSPAITAQCGLDLKALTGDRAMVYYITARQNDVTFTITGGHRLTLEAETTVRIAFDLRYDEPTFYALSVSDGTVRIGQDAVTAGSDPVFASGEAVLDQPGADDFLDAATREAEATTLLASGNVTGDDRDAARDQQDQASSDIEQALPAALLDEIHRPPYVPRRPLAEGETLGEVEEDAETSQGVP